MFRKRGGWYNQQDVRESIASAISFFRKNYDIRQTDGHLFRKLKPSLERFAREIIKKIDKNYRELDEESKRSILYHTLRGEVLGVLYEEYKDLVDTQRTKRRNSLPFFFDQNEIPSPNYHETPPDYVQEPSMLPSSLQHFFRQNDVLPPQHNIPTGVDKRAIARGMNSAIKDGVYSFVTKHKRFLGYEQYVENYLDNKLVGSLLSKIISKVNPGWSTVKQEKFVKDNLAKYISNGELFQREFLKNSGLESLVSSLGKIKNVFGIGKNEAGEYFDKTAETVRNFSEGINSLYGENLPDELKKVKRYVSNYEKAREEIFTAELLASDEDGAFISKKELPAFRRKKFQEAKHSYDEARTSVRKYLGLEKVASVFIFIFGLSLLAGSGMRLTGNAVRNINYYPPVWAGFFIGLILIFAGFFWFAKLTRERKVKKHLSYLKNK